MKTEARNQDDIYQDDKVLCHFCNSEMSRFVVNGVVYYKCRNNKCGHVFCGGRVGK